MLHGDNVEKSYFHVMVPSNQNSELQFRNTTIVKYKYNLTALIYQYIYGYNKIINNNKIYILLSINITLLL